MMRRAFTLLFLSAAVLLADASPADALFRHRHRCRHAAAVIVIEHAHGYVPCCQASAGYPSSGYGSNPTYSGTQAYYPQAQSYQMSPNGSLVPAGYYTR